MLRHIRPALVMLIGISVITGLIYPLTSSPGWHRRSSPGRRTAA